MSPAIIFVFPTCTAGKDVPAGTMAVVRSPEFLRALNQRDCAILRVDRAAAAFVKYLARAPAAAYWAGALAPAETYTRARGGPGVPARPLSFSPTSFGKRRRQTW